MTAGPDFELPPELEAGQPPEARGLARDGVRLLVADGSGMRHARFTDLGGFLRAGDVLVVNTSATLAAAVDGQRPDGAAVVVHFSTLLDDGCWLVELRPPGRATGPVTDASAGERVGLPAGAALVLLAAASSRFWRARVAVEGDVRAYLSVHGRPISYAYLAGSWPLTAYQTVFARDPGSAEMPSAGRPFSTDLVTALVAGGVVIAPITLHAGVSSPEAGEPPLREWLRIPEPTADLVTHARSAERRIIAARPLPGRWRAARGRTAPWPPPKAGRTSCSARAGRPGRSTGSSPAGTPRARHTWNC